MPRSELTIDLGALRRNVRTLLRALDGAALWAVVKADGYGHGAVDVSRAALEAGASALCVATIPEAVELRGAFPDARILCRGSAEQDELRDARQAGVEVAWSGGEVPEGVRVHVKLDTGMGRYGLAELPAPTRDVVGLMSHLASSDSDRGFTEHQIERFRLETAPYSDLTRHLANSAAALRLPEAQFRVIHMRFVEQKSIREIAQELGRSEGVVKQLQLCAIESLRAQMEGAHA